jgi:hypothetical protein
MQQGCPQRHEEVPSALETLLLESASYIKINSYLGLKILLQLYKL